ncbi:MAG: hypothetical protein U9O98_05060 [Asgard group archaeon]|nr:hypothetical protein [Asgard group archaeon]
MLFAIDEDGGTPLQINASSLSEREAIATTIQGFTAVGLGRGDIRGLFGPLPVAYNNNFKTIVYVFRVIPEKSFNNTVLTHSKFCALFIIFRTEMLHYIANVFSMIESLLNMYQENYLLREEDLQKGSLQKIYDEVIKTLKLKPRIRLFRIENNIVTEFEGAQFVLSSELSLFISEKNKKMFLYWEKNVDEQLKEKYTNIVQELNKSEYQNKYNILDIDNKKQLLTLLDDYNITLVEN